MKTLLALMWVTIAAFLPIQAHEGHEELENAVVKVQFTPPNGWQFAEVGEFKHVHVMVTTKSEKAMPPSISLGTDHFHGNLQDYLKIVKKINDVKGDEWKDLGKIQTEAGEASLSQVNTKSQWGDLRLMHAILLRDGIAYILTVAALKDDFSKYYKEFFQAMRSLKFVDNATQPSLAKQDTVVDKLP